MVIQACNRLDDLRRLLWDIIAWRGRHKIHVTVYDDASDGDTSEVEALLGAHKWEYRRSSRRYGKVGFRQWTSIAYAEQRRRPEPYFVFLPDDVRLCSKFFDRVLSYWNSIVDPHKAALSLYRDRSRDGRPSGWTKTKPRSVGNVIEIGWVDGAAFCERSYLRALEYRVPRFSSEQAKNPHLSSGVGKAVSQALDAKGMRMYCVRQSLLSHVGAYDSVMNPVARKRSPLVTIKFADGDRLQAAFLARIPVTVSVASIPTREADLRRMVDSLYWQCDHLNVYLNRYKSVPPFLNRPRITVACSQDHGDLGDAGKFFWSDKVEGYHLTADDDIVYPPNYVAHMVRKIEDYKRKAVVGVHGAVLPRRPRTYYAARGPVYQCGQDLGADRRVHVLGTGTAAYHTSAIKLSPEDFKLPNMADIWLGIAAKNQQTPLVVVAHRGRWLRFLPDRGDSIFHRYARKRDQAQNRAVSQAAPWPRI